MANDTTQETKNNLTLIEFYIVVRKCPNSRFVINYHPALDRTNQNILLLHLLLFIVAHVIRRVNQNSI